MGNHLPAFVASLSLAVVHGQPTNPSLDFRGNATVYVLESPSSGSCNFRAWPRDVAAESYATVSHEQWDDRESLCGQCAEVWRVCETSACQPAARQIVHVVDQCSDCEHGDLFISSSVFQQIARQSEACVPIQWRFVDCNTSSGERSHAIEATIDTSSLRSLQETSSSSSADHNGSLDSSLHNAGGAGNDSVTGSADSSRGSMAVDAADSSTNGSTSSAADPSSTGRVGGDIRRPGVAEVAPLSPSNSGIGGVGDSSTNSATDNGGDLPSNDTTEKPVSSDSTPPDNVHNVEGPNTSATADNASESASGSWETLPATKAMPPPPASSQSPGTSTLVVAQSTASPSSEMASATLNQENAPVNTATHQPATSQTPSTSVVTPAAPPSTTSLPATSSPVTSSIPAADTTTPSSFPQPPDTETAPASDGAVSSSSESPLQTSDAASPSWTSNPSVSPSISTDATSTGASYPAGAATSPAESTGGNTEEQEAPYGAEPADRTADESAAPLSAEPGDANTKESAAPLSETSVAPSTTTPPKTKPDQQRDGSSGVRGSRTVDSASPSSIPSDGKPDNLPSIVAVQDNPVFYASVVLGIVGFVGAVVAFRAKRKRQSTARRVNAENYTSNTTIL